MSDDLDAAFLVVLHIPPHTESHLHEIIAARTSLKVVAALDRQALRAGHVYVASADLHLIVEAGMVRLTRGPKECRMRPAIDVLLRSAAVAYGPRTIGIVLSGMLDDGTAGLWAVKDRHGVAMVQDPAEAMYPSMPQSAIDHVETDFVGTVAMLAREIGRVTSGQPQPSPETDTSLHRTETRIADEGNALQLGVMNLGSVSKYTCPDCRGVLVQITEGPIVRFRCHTGHAYSLQTLQAEVSESIDRGLWATLRAIEERIMLLRQTAELAAARGDGFASGQCQKLADQTEDRLKPLRALVLDKDLFGRQS